MENRENIAVGLDIGTTKIVAMIGKKNEYGNIQFVLIDGIGKIIINQSVENELILKAFEDYKS
jgi:cell division ATPase FtsA